MKLTGSCKKKECVQKTGSGFLLYSYLFFIIFTHLYIISWFLKYINMVLNIDFLFDGSHFGFS